MRTLSRVVLAALAALTFIVAVVHAEDASVQRFGAKITAKKAVDIAALAQAPQNFNGKTIRLEGTVKDVCQGMGCWVEVVDANGASFIARSLDEKILLPKDCKGRKVVVQGKVKTLPAKVKAEKPEDGHACPKPEYVVATTGVELASN